MKYELAKLLELKTQDQNEINRIGEEADLKERECESNAFQIKNKEYELYKAQERLNELTRLMESRNFEMSDVHNNCDDASDELSRLKEEYYSLISESKSLQQNLDINLANK